MITILRSQAHRILAWGGLLPLLLIVGPLVAQVSCPALVEEALSRADDHCRDLSRNAACYGHRAVSALFTEDVPDDFFSQPADQSDVEQLRRIETVPMQPENRLWGVALMKIQANLPDTLPGQAATMVLLGDIEVENAVQPEDALQYDASLVASVESNAALRARPSSAASTLALIPTGAEIALDARSDDDAWVRAVYDDLYGWVSRSVLSISGDHTTLPILDGTQFTPMQAFYLRTGIGQAACEEAPQDTLIIQTPQGTEIEFQVNGADIRVGSTVLLRILPPGDRMELTVLDGRATILANPFNPGGLTVYAGQRSIVCLTPPDNRGLDGESNDRVINCGWSPPQDVLQSDLARAWCSLEQIPDTLLYYPVDLRCDLLDAPPPMVDQQPVIMRDRPANPPVVTPVNTPHPQDIHGDPTDNHCYRGGVWGDGRCNNPDDLALTNWYWTAGWYLVRFEDGRIAWEDLPEPYRPATPEPEPPEPVVSGGFSATWACTGPTTITMSFSNAPAGTTSVTLSLFEDSAGAFQTSVVGVPPTGGSAAFTIVPIVGAARDAHAATATLNPSGTVINIAPADLNCS